MTRTLVVALAVTFSAATAWGSLVGEPISAEFGSGANGFDQPGYGINNTGGGQPIIANSIIGPGIEFNPLFSQVSVDVADGTIVIAYGGSSQTGFSNTTFNGFVIRFTDPSPPIVTGASLVSQSGVGTPLTANEVEFSPQAIAINFTDNTFDGGGSVTVDYTYIPEPASMALLAGSGLILLHRRMKRA